MASETERISRLLEKTFDKQPWYGTSIMETLRDVKPEITGSRLGDTHSIIELVLHMTAWRRFVTRRLQDDNDYQITDDLNFPKPGTWDSALEEFRESQQKLIAAIQSFPETRLGELVPSSSFKYTFYTLLHGIIQHDIYHLGQIALIKKSHT